MNPGRVFWEQKNDQNSETKEKDEAPINRRDYMMHIRIITSKDFYNYRKELHYNICVYVDHAL